MNPESTAYQHTLEIVDHWFVGDVQSVSHLSGGETGSTVVKVDTEFGSYVLKRLENWETERFDFIYDVLLHVQSQGVLVDVSVLTSEGKVVAETGRERYILNTFLEGDASADRDRNQKLLRNIGMAIGNLHSAFASYPNEGLGEKTWRERDWLSHNRDRAIAEAGLDSKLLSILTEAKSLVVDELCELLAQLPEQLVHRDCHFLNIVTMAEDTVGFVDCDHLSICSPMLDLEYFCSDTS
jgi:Ser/Thr protein kinase RdoA (MazF antagonist)